MIHILAVFSGLHLMRECRYRECRVWQNGIGVQGIDVHIVPIHGIIHLVLANQITGIVNCHDVVIKRLVC